MTAPTDGAAGEALTAETLAAMESAHAAVVARLPLPWVVDREDGGDWTVILRDASATIAIVSDGEGADDVALIIRTAVNHHGLLLREVARQREENARLTAALAEAQHSAAMACIDTDPDCECAGCLYAREHHDAATGSAT